MNNYPKRLIEVDLPIKRISAHARREKSIRHGHISTLHIWWARRPLAACRAVICAALWFDPADEKCPTEFRDAVREQMRKWARDSRGLMSAESYAHFEAVLKEPARLEDDEMLRTLLLDFIADFANWDNSTRTEYLEAARFLTHVAHLSLVRDSEFLILNSELKAKGEWSIQNLKSKIQNLAKPLVVDPFAGGGAIPLEALRVGADAFASDLNPVAVLLNKVVLEYIPRYACLSADRGNRLADEVRKWGAWVKAEAEKELAEFYPCLPAGRRKNPDDAPPNKFYVYVLRCSDGSLYKGQTDNLKRRVQQHESGLVDWTKHRLPVDLIHYEMFEKREDAVAREKYLKSGMGREWLNKQFPKETPIAYLWARTIVCEGVNCGAEVPLMRSLWLAKKAGRSTALRMIPDREKKRVDFEVVQNASGVNEGTVRRGSATCPVCGFTTPVASVRQQMRTRRGGARDARLFCVVTTKPSEQGRFYRLPTKRDIAACASAQETLQQRVTAHNAMSADRQGDLSLVPDEPLPPQGTLGFRVQLYGMEQWGDLFTPRQALALTTLARLVREAGKRLTKKHEQGFADAVQTCLACVVDRQADYLSSLTIWANTGEFIAHTFGRQALPIVWEFPECQPLADGSGNWDGAVEWVSLVIEALVTDYDQSGNATLASATAHPLSDDSANAFITDPPYKDAVPYADLSDFFYVWLKRTLPTNTANAFSELLTPKDDECIVDEVTLPHE